MFDSIVGPVGPWPSSPGFQDPCATVDEIAALGLRHVGYAVPIELFEPFVEGWHRWTFGGDRGYTGIRVYLLGF